MVGVASDLGRLAMQRIARKAEDAEQPGQRFLCPLLRPVQRRTLRVCIDDDNALSIARPSAGEMQRQRRLADAALLVEERDDHDASPRPYAQRCCGARRNASPGMSDLPRRLLLPAWEPIRSMTGIVDGARASRSLRRLDSWLVKLESRNFPFAADGSPDFGS